MGDISKWIKRITGDFRYMIIYIIILLNVISVLVECVSRIVNSGFSISLLLYFLVATLPLGFLNRYAMIYHGKGEKSFLLILYFVCCAVQAIIFPGKTDMVRFASIILPVGYCLVMIVLFLVGVRGIIPIAVTGLYAGFSLVTTFITLFRYSDFMGYATLLYILSVILSHLLICAAGYLAATEK